MTAAGFIFMAASWAAIVALNVFCFAKLWSENHRD